MSKKAGSDGKLYYNPTAITDTDYATHLADVGTVEADVVRDVNVNLEQGQADITTRGNSGWRQTLPTLKDGTIEFEIVWDEADAAFGVFRDAWKNKTEVFVFAASGDKATSGSEGPIGNFVVVDFSRSEPLDDAMVASVTLKPFTFNDYHEIP